jgi:hypothetical protein
VTKHQSKIDQRPFRSKADRQFEESLETKYRSVAIPEVVAALQQRAGTPEPSDTPQMS